MENTLHFENLLGAVNFLYQEGYRTEYYLKKEGLWNSTTGICSPFISVRIIRTVMIASHGEVDTVKCIHAIQLEDGSKGAYIDMTGKSFA